MNSQSPVSRILIVHPINPEKIEFGADVVPNVKRALEKNNPYSCILINLTLENKIEVFNYMDQMLVGHPNIQFIIIINNLDKKEILELIAKKNIFKIINSFNLSQITQEILYAIDKYDQQEQNQVLLSLINEQNKQLDIASKNLEKAVKKRQSYLQKSKFKLEQTNNTYKLLKNALIAINKSRSIAEMEQNLFQVLSKSIKLSWVRIFYKTQEEFINQFFNSQTHKNVYKQVLLSQSEVIGWCVYATEEAATPNEEDFFEKISDTLGLAIDKMMKLDQMEVLMSQWESTFNSINQSIALVDHDFQIIQTNTQFNTSAKGDKKNIKNNCFEMFLNEDLSEKFQSNNISELSYKFDDKNGDIFNYDISLQPIKTNYSKKIYLVIFRDLSEEIKMENYLIQSSKMAELGTIGSSIAHELNNPLGGIISFLQLIKMDIDESHKYFDDVIEMEDAAMRSKDIVQNLLGFSRFQSGSPNEEFLINEAIENALKILELQTRSKGIEVEKNLINYNQPILGNKNQFTQAIVNIIQNSLDAILQDLNSNPGEEGVIRVVSKLNPKNEIEITITDNGPGICKKIIGKIFDPLFTTKKKGSGLGLTVAYQILSQHNAQLEIFSQPQAGTSAKILIRTKS